MTLKPMTAARRLGMAVACAALTWTTAATAQSPDPDPERGRALAERWCSECHLVAPDGPGGDAGPAFQTLAKARSDAALRAWLSDPHPPMPSMDLSNLAVEDIAAHIRSLGACEVNC